MLPSIPVLLLLPFNLLLPFLFLLLLLLLQQVLNVAQRARSRLQQLQILQNLPLPHLPQTRRAHAVLGEQVIHKLIHKRQRRSIPPLPPQLSPVLQQRLQPRIHILVLARQADVESGQGAQVFELFSTEAQVLVEDGVAGRELKQLEGETEEGRRLLNGARYTADEVDVLHDAVDNVGFVDREALFFVEVAVDDALADSLLHDGGWVEAVGRKRAGAAALVEEAALIGLVELGFGFGFRHRGLFGGGVVVVG